MRKSFVALAAAATLSFAVPSYAQVATNITVGSKVVQTNNNGGAWSATSSVGLGSSNATTFTVYCFDNLRYFTPNLATQYVALTFTQFVTGVGAGPGGRGANWNTLTTNDMNSMAALALTYGGNAATNTTIQQNMWDIGNNAVQGTNTNTAFASSWMVLVDKAEWERGLTGQNGLIRGSQSFLIQVPSAIVTTPEPSTYVLMAAGLAGLGLTARRRRRV